LGDPTKAKQVLGWEPKVGFEGLVRMMVAADLRAFQLDVPFETASRATGSAT
jgi:GDPmannose 4,6-dehydratase